MKTVLFSGGYDSTYLLWKTLEDMKCNEKLNVVSVEADFLGKKNDREREARNRIMTYLKAKYYDRNIVYNVVKIDATTNSKIEGGAGLCQPMFWIPTTILSSEIGDNEILLSYITGDQALSYKENIVNIFNNYAELNGHNNKHFKVSFPLEVIYKEEIIKEMIDKEEFLFYNCTTCEDWSDKDDWCGKCGPCRNLKAALVNLLVDDNSSEKVKTISSAVLKVKFDTSISISKYSERETVTPD